MYTQDFKTRQKRNAYRLRKIAKHSSGDILDIGYSYIPNKYLKGDFIVGYDINKAEKNFENYTKIIIGINDQDFKKIHHKFDTIIMGEFIEHVTNPYDWIEMCVKKLKPKGKIIISTPNPYFLEYIALNIFNGEDNPTHIFLFDRITLKRVMKRFNFELKKTYGTVFSFPGICNRILVKCPFWFFSFSCIYIFQKNGRRNTISHTTLQ